MKMFHLVSVLDIMDRLQFFCVFQQKIFEFEDFSALLFIFRIFELEKKYSSLTPININ